MPKVLHCSNNHFLLYMRNKYVWLLNFRKEENLPRFVWKSLRNLKIAQKKSNNKKTLVLLSKLTFILNEEK